MVAIDDETLYAIGLNDPTSASSLNLQSIDRLSKNGFVVVTPGRPGFWIEIVSITKKGWKYLQAGSLERAVIEARDKIDGKEEWTILS